MFRFPVPGTFKTGMMSTIFSSLGRWSVVQGGQPIRPQWSEQGSHLFGVIDADRDMWPAAENSQRSKGRHGEPMAISPISRTTILMQSQRVQKYSSVLASV